MSCKLTYQDIRYNSVEELQQFLRPSEVQEGEEVSATVNIVETPGFRTYTLDLVDGQRIGRVRTRPTLIGWEIESSLVNPEYQNQGIGTELYTEALTDLLSRGETLFSDSTMEPQARSVWTKLVDAGLAEFNQEIGRFQASPTPNTLDSNGEASSQEVLNFINETNTENIKATQEDIVDIINSMVGFESTEEMISQMRKAMVPRGTFKPSFTSLTTNGYTEAEAENILASPELQNRLRENLAKLENIEVPIEIESSEFGEFATSTEVDFMGRYKRVNPHTLKSEAIEEVGGIQEEGEFENAIENTEYEVFSDQFEEFSQYRRVPVMRYNEEGVLEPKPKHSPADLVGAYMDSEPNSTIESSSEAIMEASSDILEFNYDSTEKVLKNIEKEAAKKGVDLVGLHEKYLLKGVEQTQVFLAQLRELNSEGFNDNFKESYDNFFDIQGELESYMTNREGSIIKIENSPKTAVESFVEDGMLHISDNLYRKVDNTMYLGEYLDIGERRLDIFPKEIFNRTNMSNKQSVRLAIEQYLESESENLEHTSELTEDQKKSFVINSRYFSVPLNRNAQIKNIAELDTSLNTEKFQRDFYKKFLGEKIKGSREYDNFYSKIRPTTEGLEFGETDAISLRLIQELSDDQFKKYMSMKKDSDINYYETSGVQEESFALRNQYFNYPTSLEKFKGVYNKINENTVSVEGDVQDFIRTRDGVFELVDYNGQTGFYTRLGENNSNFVRALEGIGEVNTDSSAIPTTREAETKINNPYTKAEGEQIQNTLEC